MYLLLSPTVIKNSIVNYQSVGREISNASSYIEDTDVLLEQKLAIRSHQRCGSERADTKLYRKFQD